MIVYYQTTAIVFENAGTPATSMREDGTMKLFESERKVMEVLWREGEIPAKRVSEILGEEIGWNKNTTYP